MTPKSKHPNAGEKWCVARHRGMSASEADRCERAIERSERQAAQQECDEGAREYADCMGAAQLQALGSYLEKEKQP